MWKIISALSLNSISFFDNGMKKFKEVLRLFADVTNSNLDDGMFVDSGYGYISNKGIEVCSDSDLDELDDT